MRPFTARQPGCVTSIRVRMMRSLPNGAAILVAVAVALGFANSRPALADQGHIIHLTGSAQSLDIDLVLLCPQSGSAAPRLQNQKTGRISPIVDPQLRAVADKACHPSLGTGERSTVSIVNSAGKPIVVGFAPQAGSQITWGAGCGTVIGGTTVILRAGGTCLATVTDSVASPGSRFCAVTAEIASSAGSAAASAGLDCSKAQQRNQTLIETYFQPAPCFGAGTPNCIWYDISAIPSTCTDQAWSTNHCANTGGAAYNLPVMLSCPDEPTYVCRGPANSKYGPAHYPSNCGNPAAKPVSGPIPEPAGLNAYFYPDDNSYGQPNAVCPNGQPLTIKFLPGA